MRPNFPEMGDKPTSPAVASAGIGLRHAYYEQMVTEKPKLGWVEVHPENYFGDGIHRHYLEKAREIYPLSFHGVGLSLGSADGISTDHLQRIKELADIYQPFQISDHASWSMSGNAHLNDLLPLPYTQETLQHLCNNIDKAQNYLGRKILIENPSTYVAFEASTMTEWQMMNAAAQNSGCGILLDINNIFVQAHNHHFDAKEYITNIAPEAVGEIHLAGHSERVLSDGSVIFIDTHDKLVKPEVWDLYEFTIHHTGPVPTLIEWDQNFPELDVILMQARTAEKMMLQYEELRYAAE